MALAFSMVMLTDASPKQFSASFLELNRVELEKSVVMDRDSYAMSTRRAKETYGFMTITKLKKNC